eukprot:1667842-Pleurochrysis_carterae.AAC.2
MYRVVVNPSRHLRYRDVLCKTFPDVGYTNCCRTELQRASSPKVAEINKPSANECRICHRERSAEPTAWQRSEQHMDTVKAAPNLVLAEHGC